MVTTHYQYLPASINWHAVVDDFGTLRSEQPTSHAWASAYLFANGQSFEQAGMLSISALVDEH